MLKSVGDPDALGSSITDTSTLSTTAPLASLPCNENLSPRGRDSRSHWMPAPALPASSIVTALAMSGPTVRTALSRLPAMPTNITRLEMKGTLDREMTLVGPVGAPYSSTGVTKSTMSRSASCPTFKADAGWAA